METQRNPVGHRRREARRLGGGPRRPDASPTNPDAEYLYYVGCAGSFDDRNKKTTQAFAKILKKAGVDFAILGKRGAVQRRDGAPPRQRVPLSRRMAQMCVEMLNGYGVQEDHHQLPALLQHASRTSSRSSAAHYEVIHATEFVQAADRRRQAAASSGGSESRPSPTTTPATSAATTTCTTRRATSSAKSGAGSWWRWSATGTSACAAAPAAAACGWRRIPTSA